MLCSDLQYLQVNFLFIFYLFFLEFSVLIYGFWCSTHLLWSFKPNDAWNNHYKSHRVVLFSRYVLASWWASYNCSKVTKGVIVPWPSKNSSADSSIKIVVISSQSILLWVHMFQHLSDFVSTNPSQFNCKKYSRCCIGRWIYLPSLCDRTFCACAEQTFGCVN